MKTLLIVVDGMRPDALVNIPQAQSMMRKSSYTMTAQTVMPSVTLPCHVSLFHSVDPARHGTVDNTYVPQVRPIKGLCEVLMNDKKKSAFFYNWEELRDLTRPGSLSFSYFYSGKYSSGGYEKANNKVTDAATDYLGENDTDFAFLYLGYPDEAGHKYGWMSDEYMKAVQNSWENIERVVKALPEDYTVFVTADHGGHDRTHGTDMPEDMTIPMIVMGKDFVAGEELKDVTIKDVAPTVAKLLGVAPDEEWEGRSLV